MVEIKIKHARRKIVILVIAPILLALFLFQNGEANGIGGNIVIGTILAFILYRAFRLVKSIKVSNEKMIIDAFIGPDSVAEFPVTFLYKNGIIHFEGRSFFIGKIDDEKALEGLQKKLGDQNKNIGFRKLEKKLRRDNVFLNNAYSLVRPFSVVFVGFLVASIPNFIPDTTYRPGRLFLCLYELFAIGFAIAWLYLKKQKVESIGKISFNNKKAKSWDEA